MTIRYVVRPPSMLTTPRMLAQRLNAQRVVSVQARGVTFDPEQDFFMTYPVLDRMEDYDEGYRRLYDFSRRTKFDQMLFLGTNGIKTPRDYNSLGVGVRRPLRHHGGSDFTMVSSVSSSPEGYYKVPFFPKEYEYRMLYVKGTLVATLAKVMPAGTPNNVPWNHTHGASFQHVEWNRCRLRFTSVKSDLESCSVIRHASIVGVDVMLKRPEGSTNGWDYAVCEFNFCPGLSIEPVIQKVIEHANRS